MVTVDAAGRVVQANTFARQHAPTLTPGTDFRTELEKLTHAEKVDRMLLRGEIVSFPARDHGPDLHWQLLRSNQRGEQVAAIWLIDWADEMNRRRADFTMAASHELRGPLTTLMGFAEILNLDTEGMTSQQAEAAAIVEQTARHLNVLVEDVFDLSRNSFGELRLNLAETDLGEVVRAVASVVRPRIEEREQILECDIQAPLPAVEADPGRARQIITNLANNASIHNPARVSIKLSARAKGDWVEIRVEDDGVGLPFDDPDDAFRTFSRGGQATAGDRAGAGIGLSITKRLMELHRGEITVETEPGGGTRFILLFPVERETALTPGTPGPV